MKAPLRVRLAFAWVALIASQAVAQPAAPPTTVSIHVRETGGIRRSAFPVTARVPLPRAALADPARARLLLKDVEVPVQVTAMKRWPDGSIQWLDVDFNVSPGPGDSVDYVLEYGPGVSAAVVARGLSVVAATFRLDRDETRQRLEHMPAASARPPVRGLFLFRPQGNGPDNAFYGGALQYAAYRHGQRTIGRVAAVVDPHGRRDDELRIHLGDGRRKSRLHRHECAGYLPVEIDDLEFVNIDNQRIAEPGDLRS